MRLSWTRGRSLEASGKVDHVGAARQVENGTARVESSETHAAGHRERHRVGELELIPRRSRDVAARAEDARVEAPAVHADEEILPPEGGSHRNIGGRASARRSILVASAFRPKISLPRLLHQTNFSLVASTFRWKISLPRLLHDSRQISIAVRFDQCKRPDTLGGNVPSPYEI